MVKNKDQCFVPRDDDNETLHKVVKITGETKLKFRIMWEGEDPDTGGPWEQSLVLKTDCTNDLVDAWKEEKKTKARESKQRQPTNKEISLSTSSNCMPRTPVASISTPTWPPKIRKSVAGDSVVRKTIESKAVDKLAESGWLGGPADIASGLEKEGLKKDLEMATNGVKFGPPSRRKQTKQGCSSKEVIGMDMNGVKFGPPSRKKRKKQDGSSTTDVDPVKASTSSTYDPNLVIIPIMSPASVKRLANFDKEVLILNPEDNNAQGRVNVFQIENEMDIEIEDAVRTDGKEGEAIKMADALRSHGRTHSCHQETQELLHANDREQLTHEEADIGHRGIAFNEVGPLSQKNLKESRPPLEVIDGGRDSVIPSGVDGVAQSSTMTQPGPKIGTPLELSNIAKTFGVSLRGSSDTAVVVLAHQSTPADTTTSNILDMRLRASLAANDIISVIRTQGDGLRLVWIEFHSPDKARRFRHAALSRGRAPFFCEQVHQILFDAVCAFPGSDSKEWVDPKGSRRKRRKKVKPLI